MRDCFGNFPNTSGFPCTLCEDCQECRFLNVDELIKERKLKKEIIHKLNSEIFEINNQIKKLCKHDLILLKTIGLENSEYMCVRCKKYFNEIPKNSKVVTYDELKDMPKVEKIEYID